MRKRKERGCGLVPEPRRIAWRWLVRWPFDRWPWLLRLGPTPVNPPHQLTRQRRVRRGFGSGGRTQLPQFGSRPRDWKRTESAAGTRPGGRPPAGHRCKPRFLRGNGHSGPPPAPKRPTAARRSRRRCLSTPVSVWFRSETLNSPSWTRTSNLPVNSRPLYH